MGVLNRPLRRLSSHPHPPSFKEIASVHPWVSNLPVHLPSLRASCRPKRFHNDSKGSEAYGSFQGSQTSPVPRRLAYQGTITTRGTTNTEFIVNLTHSLGWIISQENQNKSPLGHFYSWAMNAI